MQIKKTKKYKTSVIRRIILLVFFIMMIGCIGMMLTFWLAQNIYGNGHAINRAGSLRMLSYKALTYAPIKNNVLGLNVLEQFDKTLNDKKLVSVIQQEQLMPSWLSLKMQWQQHIKPQLLNAQNTAQLHAQIDHFVIQIDQLVYQLDHLTENQLIYTGKIQRLFLILILLSFIFTLFQLYQRLILPWRQINTIISAIGHKDFSQKFTIRHNRQDELSQLGKTLNSVCSELSKVYHDLENRVLIKTQALALKNRYLSYLYRASCSLNSDAPLCAQISPIIQELSLLLPFTSVRLRIYESKLQEQFHEFDYQRMKRPSYCHDSDCHHCFTSLEIAPEVTKSKPSIKTKQMSWTLEDDSILYGTLIAILPESKTLDNDQQQLLMTLIELLTNSLVLERQIARNQQLLLLEERATIACELHDSLAQSLSCIKFQLGCIQMQHAAELSEQVNNELLELKKEINNAYHQLRDLLTHFRLKLVEPSLYSSLQTVIQEFEQRLLFAIEFKYQLPINHLNSHEVINVIQITREALMNIVKHAHATWAKVQLHYQQNQLILTIEDNGCGLTTTEPPKNHYGLIIMRDRAESMGGSFSIAKRQQGGTQICVALKLRE